MTEKKSIVFGAENCQKKARSAPGVFVLKSKYWTCITNQLNNN